jgi:hypothetical protein
MRGIGPAAPTRVLARLVERDQHAFHRLTQPELLRLHPWYRARLRARRPALARAEPAVRLERRRRRWADELGAPAHGAPGGAWRDARRAAGAPEHAHVPEPAAAEGEPAREPVWRVPEDVRHRRRRGAAPA